MERQERFARTILNGFESFFAEYSVAGFSGGGGSSPPSSCASAMPGMASNATTADVKRREMKCLFIVFPQSVFSMPQRYQFGLDASNTKLLALYNCSL